MSGTAALAAARKRRANPQPTGNVQTQQNPKKMESIDEEPPKMGNPALLLMQHQVIVQRLQKEINELKASISDLKVSKEKEEKDNYKSEYLGLLEEMKEMKKVLLKVQSFSMETNLEVMKLKRTTSQDKIDLSSLNVSNVTNIDEVIDSN